MKATIFQNMDYFRWACVLLPEVHINWITYIVHMCPIIENTVCLVGQISVTVDHHRKVKTTFKITRDNKEAIADLD